METLASQGKIGVWVQAPGALDSAGEDAERVASSRWEGPGRHPQKIEVYMQYPAILRIFWPENGLQCRP